MGSPSNIMTYFDDKMSGNITIAPIIPASFSISTKSSVKRHILDPYVSKETCIFL